MAVSIDDQTKVLRYIWTYPGINLSHLQVGMTIPARRIQAALEQLLADGRIKNDIKRLGDVEAVVYYPVLEDDDVEKLGDIIDTELPQLFKILKSYPETKELGERLNTVLQDFLIKDLERYGLEENQVEEVSDDESQNFPGGVDGDNDEREIEGVETHIENW